MKDAEHTLPTVRKRGMFRCPDCNSIGFITASKRETKLVKNFYVSCSNDECGGRYKFQCTPVKRIVPSLMPDKSINLPTVEPKKASAEET